MQKGIDLPTANFGGDISPDIGGLFIQRTN